MKGPQADQGVTELVNWDDADQKQRGRPAS
jgi:hypothetical protein